jgi:DNA-directed RNA polymerase subunit H (RpoH/RPB5)
MSFELIDALYRSRLTVLALLDKRGYNVKPFERFSTRQIELMLGESGGTGGSHALDFRATKKDEADKGICHVIYYLHKFRKFDDFVDDLKLSDEDLAHSEFIVLLNDEVIDAHHKSAIKYWHMRKLKVHFYNLYRLVNNPLDHILQPKFEIIPEDKHKDLLAALNCRSKGQLPVLRYHTDVVTRCLGLVPDDIVKITRSSESAGETIVYSVCKPLG